MLVEELRAGQKDNLYFGGIMITFKHRGNFNKTEGFLKEASNPRLKSIFEKYGREGQHALEEATPVDTGETKQSWHYKVEETATGYSLSWYNTVMAGKTPLVILLQYGHGTRGGTYVQGRDFINPAIQPILDKLADSLWKEVRGNA